VSADIASLEGLPDFDVTWPWSSGTTLTPGLTCVFRVRNEARNLPWVLPPILAAVDHVLFVDNGSDDGTPAVARQVARDCGAEDRLTLLDYPHEVARAGGEHLATPATSVHSLTHFYNWCFSHVRTTYSMKWDGDMVLTPEGSRILRDLSWQLQATRAIVAMPRHPLTVVDESTGWLDLSLRFLEPWVYPMGPDTTFLKAFDWELRQQPAGGERIVLEEGLVVEVKWLDADEYAHWRTEGVDFTNRRLYRKLREFEVDQAIREGRAEELGGLVRVEAPPGVHIIDHVSRDWLWRQPRPLVTHSLPASLRERVRG
jgi:glycosyltransferase involved in cell wall biosynthesis